MFPNEATRASGAPALCVSIHDAAPATWAQCEQLVAAVRAVADIPLTVLVVPRFHDLPVQPPDEWRFVRALDALARRGHELALHGYTHLDGASPARTLGARWLRTVYTEGEGEFAAIGAAEARRRIELGLEWFTRHGWRPAGFVAPAWLLGDAAWQAVREYPFMYTTTFQRFHVLPGRRSVWSPSLVYTARNRAGRLVSPHAATLLAAVLRSAPLVRLALHPRDALHPLLLAHAQRLIGRLLEQRVALTKAAVAARLGARLTTGPSIRPCPSDAVRSRSSTTDHNAAHLPSR
ncbi:MAG: DUF2334 domain-containing protein [Gammaproteobacteria bacterium]